MYNLTSQPNLNCSSTVYFNVFSDAVNESPCNYKLVALARNILKIIAELLKHIGNTLYIPQISKAVSVLGTTCKGMLLNKIVASSVDFKKTFDLNKPSEKMLYNTLDFVGDVCAASGYFGALKLAKTARVTLLANTVIDTKNHLGKVVENDNTKISSFKAKCAINKYFRVLTLGFVKHPLINEEDPKELRSIAMVKVAKDIASLFTVTISVIGLVTSTIFISDFAILLISTLSLILALSAKVMEGTTSHKVALLNIK